MNDSKEVAALRKELKESAQTVRRLKLAVRLLGAAFLVLAVALSNENIRAVLGVVLGIVGILLGVLLFIAGVRLILERLSPSPQE